MGGQRRRKQAALRRRRRSLLVGGLGAAAAAALIVGLILVAAGGDGDESPSGYAIGDIQIVPIVQGEKSGPADGASAWVVRFDAEWRGPEEPPPRALECSFTLLSENDEPLVEKPFGLFVGDGRQGVYAPVKVSGEGLDSIPASASIDCESTTEGAYETSNIQVVRAWDILFDSEWVGPGDPPQDATRCVLEVYNAPVEEERILLLTKPFEASLNLGRQDFVVPEQLQVSELRNPPLTDELEIECPIPS